MTDSILDLVSDLRRLRLERGALTYEAIARSAGLSRSIVAEAFGGTRLPSERTLFGVVTALGADPSPWLVRRAELAGGAPALPAPVAPEAGEGEQQEEVTAPVVPVVPVVPADRGAQEPADARPPVPLDPAFPGHPSTATLPAAASPFLGAPAAPAPVRRTPALAMVAAVAVAAVAGGLLSRVLWPREVVVEVAAPPVSDIDTVPVSGDPGIVHIEGANLPVTDGANIWDTKCVDDAIDVASSDREFEVHMGIRVSFACKTVWAVAYRNDGDTYGNDIRLLLYPKTDRDPGEPQEILAEDSPYAVTTMIVQESLADDRFCAEAWIINDGVEVSLGDPICA